MLELNVTQLSRRSGKNTYITMISNSVTHLRSFTNTAIAEITRNAAGGTKNAAGGTKNAAGGARNTLGGARNTLGGARNTAGGADVGTPSAAPMVAAIGASIVLVIF